MHFTTCTQGISLWSGWFHRLSPRTHIHNRPQSIVLSILHFSLIHSLLVLLVAHIFLSFLVPIAKPLSACLIYIMSSPFEYTSHVDLDLQRPSMPSGPRSNAMAWEWMKQKAFGS